MEQYELKDKYLWTYFLHSSDRKRLPKDEYPNDKYVKTVESLLTWLPIDLELKVIRKRYNTLLNEKKKKPFMMNPEFNVDTLYPESK